MGNESEYKWYKPYMVQTFKNLLLWNEKADDLETFYTASGTQAQPVLFKWWHWVDLDHVYDMVNAYTAQSHVFPSLF